MGIFKKKQGVFAAMLAAVSLAKLWGSVSGPAGSSDNSQIRGFKGWPGNARARGRAKRKAKLRAMRASAKPAGGPSLKSLTVDALALGLLYALQGRI